jgi:hypothetical protein
VYAVGASPADAIFKRPGSVATPKSRIMASLGANTMLKHIWRWKRRQRSSERRGVSRRRPRGGAKGDKGGYKILVEARDFLMRGEEDHLGFLRLFLQIHRNGLLGDLPRKGDLAINTWIHMVKSQQKSLVATISMHR